MVSPSGSEASILAFSVEFLRGRSGSMVIPVTLGGELRIRAESDEASFPWSLLSEGGTSMDRTDGGVSLATGFSGASPVQPTVSISANDTSTSLLPAHILIPKRLFRIPCLGKESIFAPLPRGDVSGYTDNPIGYQTFPVGTSLDEHPLFGTQ